MATYTKYVTPVTAKICQSVWFTLHGIQNSVILLTNVLQKQTVLPII
jgi:hypothetical protein